jgi:hypothetical protein
MHLKLKPFIYSKDVTLLTMSKKCIPPNILTQSPIRVVIAINIYLLLFIIISFQLLLFN